MSDTPIDADLPEKVSFRAPPFLSDRVAEFKDEYNERIRDLDGSESETDAYTLDSESEAFRRLLDIGHGAWKTHGLPFGYAFDIEMLDADDAAPDDIVCPDCGADGIENFRATVDLTDDGEGITLDRLGCTACGEKFAPEDGITNSLVSF